MERLRINIVDTPGQNLEERSKEALNGRPALLLVDAVEGPMPQTSFN